MDNTLENNKIIAEFMGIEFMQSKSRYILNTVEQFSNSEILGTFKFKSSWDWLMPVVKKCLIGEAETNRPDLVSNIYESLVNLEINLVYKDIVEFIKWYNQQNKS